MRSRILFTILPALLVFSARPVAAQSCEMLSSLKLPDATITMAQSVPAGAFTPPQGGGRGGGAQFTDLPAFCRVAATLKPSPDSDIKVELWLPSSGWNDKQESSIGLSSKVFDDIGHCLSLKGVVPLICLGVLHAVGRIVISVCQRHVLMPVPL